MNPLELKTLKTIQRFKLFSPGCRVVVAVSGGPDSVVLLSVLHALNIRLCLKIVVAHLDHNIRKGSGSDLVFVKKIAESFGFPFYSRRVDWKKEREGPSLEDVLRKLRYNFLLETAKKIKADVIAIGHTEDDQAETVLMRILRGSGLYGLSAILPKRSLDGVSIVRPLIQVSRKEIMDYLRRNKLAYRIDKSNFEDKFLRNKIRNDLLPLIERRYNPNIKEGLSNLARAVGADYRYLEALAGDFFKKYVQCRKKAYCLPLGPLKALDISLRRLVLRKITDTLLGDLRSFNFQHWEEVEELIDFRPVRSEVHLPRGIFVLKNKNSLSIGHF